MTALLNLKADLRACGVPRVTVEGSRVMLPKRVFSIDLWKSLERNGWREEHYETAYGGYSCTIKLSKEGRHITISDFHDRVTIFMKAGF